MIKSIFGSERGIFGEYLMKRPHDCYIFFDCAVGARETPFVPLYWGEGPKIGHFLGNVCSNVSKMMNCFVNS